MSDVETIFSIGCGIIGAAFGAGGVFASMKGKINLAAIDASTAKQQADAALARLAEEKNRSTRQDGELRLYEERIANLRADVDGLMGAVYQSRIPSPARPIPQVRAPIRPDVPRQDSDPPLPPMRGRLGSRRE